MMSYASSAGLACEAVVYLGSGFVDQVWPKYGNELKGCDSSVLIQGICSPDLERLCLYKSSKLQSAHLFHHLYDEHDL